MTNYQRALYLVRRYGIRQARELIMFTESSLQHQPDTPAYQAYVHRVICRHTGTSLSLDEYVQQEVPLA